MCGILAVLGCSDDSQAKRVRVLELSRRLKHRGPDWSGLYQHGDCYLAHQRLAIVDPASGDQPLFNEDKTIVVTVNGEIYNHEQLRKQMPNHKFRTGSDCDVIAHLYEEHGEDFVDMLDGIFAFVLLDTRDNSFLVARDAIGITSLYIGWGLDGSVWISSELKGLSDDCEHFEVFPPGHLYSSKNGGFRRWYNPPWFSEAVPSAPYDPLVLRRAFENAVIKRLMTDVPFGVLLSGGLDSSLVASITARYLAGTKAAKQWGAQLHSFCVGLEGSPDLKAAREVADYLGTVHHEFHFTVQDGIDAIEDVIYHIETYDVTTIRASTPMFLMSRKIKSLGVKMVISGEGSDEVFGGYLYFHKAPNKEEFHMETCRKIKALHQYDCLRANKSTSAWGLEARVPFLDKEFINIAMSIDPEWKLIKPEQRSVDEHKEVEDNTATIITDGDARSNEVSETKDDVKNTATAKMPEPATPNLPVKSATAKAGQHTGEASNKIFDEAKMEDEDEDDEDEDWSGDGSPEDQAAFMIELESFYRERAMEFKPPKFYGHQLNCLKLWRSVIRLGGYDRVTGSKLWRQVGESFNPPKTCTTVSWTFRIFYEKAILEYERHKTQSGKLRLPISALPEAGVDNEGNAYQTPGSGRARRDAAARAMQGWHEQSLLGCGEDKNANSTPKREKNLKSIGSLKHKRPNEVENPAKAARTETYKQLFTTVVDLGPPADWVKINVRETKDCFEVYALVPGLLREEVRVQSDPAGRLVITGQPEQLENPWGITAFKKVVSLPARIDPLQTSAVVSLHGRLFVRVPFAQ